MTTIDVHAHLLPTSAADVLRRGEGDWFGVHLATGPGGTPVMTAPGGRRRALGTVEYLKPLDHRLEWMDRAGVDVQVLSVAPPLLGYDLPEHGAVAMCRDVNDEIADLAGGSPRFLGLAMLPASHPVAAVAELERVMALPGIVGVELGTNVDGRSWDDPGLFPLLSAAADLGALVLLHPNDVRGDTGLSGYHLRNLIGNPLESTQAAASLVFGGVLDRLPHLQVCLCHGGGYLALAAGRFDHGWRVRPEAGVAIQAPPTDYVRRFLVDALLHSQEALRLVVDVIGAENVVMGTDHPADMGLEEPVAAITSNPLLHDEEKAAVLGGNLARVLGLPAPTDRSAAGGTPSPVARPA